jgi:hypothetical protein
VTTTNPFAGTSLADSLREMHDVYTDAFNRAVGEDRDDLVSEYNQEALTLMARVLPVAA